jgi:cyclopropane fatty-acyl-phospholipid synthase-like methyltransferase
VHVGIGKTLSPYEGTTAQGGAAATFSRAKSTAFQAVVLSTEADQGCHRLAGLLTGERRGTDRASNATLEVTLICRLAAFVECLFRNVSLRRLFSLGVLTAVLAAASHAAPVVYRQIPPPGLVIGFEPSPLSVAEAILDLAAVKPDDVVYDLGSGDGRIVILAAQKYGARGVGIELQPGLVQASRQASLLAGVADRVTFVQEDLYQAEISDATVVVLYLWPSANDRLEAKLRRELRPGTRIVSRLFGIGKWNPEATVRAGNGDELMLWTVPRRSSRTPDVEFVPTPQPVADEMLRLANVASDDVVFDLGSGDGRIVILAAQKYGARGVGIELDPALVELSRQVAQQGDVGDKVKFTEGDLFTADITDATVVALFLSAGVNASLETRLRGLRPGTRIVSRQFPIGEWTPDKTVRAEDGTQLFLWTVQPR